jgi:hypothetical protein
MRTAVVASVAMVDFLPRYPSRLVFQMGFEGLRRQVFLSGPKTQRDVKLI